MTATTPEHEPGPRRRTPLWWRRFALLPRTVRVTTYVAVALVLVLVAASIAGVVLVRRSFPQTSGTLEVPGLAGRVEVVRDDHGIAQIYADSSADLFLAEGYVHAQDRFFEMDVRRHASAGRLAELFGPDAVESDLYVRTMGWRRVAERELPLLDPDTRAALDAYAEGVNAYLAGKGPSQVSLEYAVLGAGGLDYTPEPWTAADSLAWLKAMAWDLRGNMQDEIDRTLAAQAVGGRRARELWPSYDADGVAPIVDQGRVVDGVFEQDATKGGTRNPTRPAPGRALDRSVGVRSAGLAGLERLGRGTGRMPAWLGRGDGLGSNAWVVSGEHTASGEPLLADDPHLATSVPGTWMQVGLHCRTVGPDCPYDVAGFSAAGVPGVLIGHNDRIAWGFSNLGADVTDLFVERVDGATYRSGGRALPVRTRTETIAVAGGDDVTVTVRSTRHGPIVSDVDQTLARVADASPVARRVEPGERFAVALGWTALTPSRTADAVLALDRAQDWSGFRDALSTFAAPATNVVYADVDGHVGYQAVGAVPIRKSGNDGSVPVAGWRRENDWTGELVPYAGLPAVLDPDSGVLVAANQQVVGADYPYLLADDWDHGYRAARIRALLQERITAGTPLTTADLASVQQDDATPLGPLLVPLLLTAPVPAGYYSTGRELLAGWDFGQPASGPGSGAAAYLNAVWRNLLRLTFHDELPENLWPDGGQRWVAVVQRLLDDPTDPWWDDVTTDERETRDEIVLEAAMDARDELTSRLAVDASDWAWGDLHRLELHAQPTGSWGSVARRLLDRGGWGASGSGLAVDATAWDAADGYDVVTAPSMRMVVDLADLDASTWVSLTGVSGHAFDDHYTDQTDLLVEGSTLRWAFREDAVRAAGEDVLVLQPAQP